MPWDRIIQGSQRSDRFIPGFDLYDWYDPERKWVPIEAEQISTAKAEVAAKDQEIVRLLDLLKAQQ